MAAAQNRVNSLICFDRRSIERAGMILPCVTFLFALIVEMPGNRCRAQQVVEQGEQLIVNGGLEGEYRQHATYAHPPQWGGNIFGQAKGRYVEETHNPHSGRSALKIECDALPMGGISFYQADQLVPLIPGRKYILSAWMRSDTDAREITMGIQDCRELTKHVKLTRDWRKYTLEKTYGGISSANFIVFCYFDPRPGNLVIDDISLEIIEDEEAAQSISRNLLPNAGFTVARSGFAPDWWNWYGGTGRNDWPECWCPVDDYYIPGTRSMRLADDAKLLTSYLRVRFEKDITFTFSVYLKSAKPDTKVHMQVGGWKGINDVSQWTVGTEWQRYHVTGTARQRHGRPFMNLSLEGAGPLWINAPQLEQGDKPTKWRPGEGGKPRIDDVPTEMPAIPRIDCVMVEQSPIIDGLLDDAAWQQAAATSTFMVLDLDQASDKTGTLASPVTDAYFCHDDENIYVAFRCHEPSPEPRVQQRNRDDYGVLADDCVEVFLSGKVDGTDYLHLAVNVRGNRYDARGYERTFDTEWDCKTRINNGAWSVELAIPFDSIGVEPGDPLRINLARYRAQRNGMEQYSSLAPVDDSFHDAERFCFLGAGEEDFTESSPIAGLEGELVAYLDRSFYTTEANASIFINAPEGTVVGLKMKDSQRAEALDATRLITINLSSLAIGKYPIQVTVGEWHVELVLKKLEPKQNAVKIDRIHRILLVDNEPYVPFAITGSDGPSVKAQAKLGFNTAYATMHREFDEVAQKRLRGALDAAETLGNKIIIWYGHDKWRDDRETYEAELLEVIDMFKDHPALLGWWVFDEPLITELPWLEGLCDSVNKADPYHPAFINWVDRGAGWTRRMGDLTGDISCNNGPYINWGNAPPHLAYETIMGHCRQMTADAKRAGRVVAYINGVHGWTSGIREPSPAETRFLTYVTLIGGSRTLLYYTWGPPMNMELRQTFGPLQREMQFLTPIVANPEVKEKVTCNNPLVDYTAFEADDGLYVIAVNTVDAPQQAEFRIRKNDQAIEVLFEDRRIAMSDGRWLDQLEPLQPLVYRMTGNGASRGRSLPD